MFDTPTTPHPGGLAVQVRPLQRGDNVQHLRTKEKYLLNISLGQEQYNSYGLLGEKQEGGGAGGQGEDAVPRV